LPLREIHVDYDRDNDPQKPIASIHEITIKNNTPNRLVEILLETNLPKGSYEFLDIPDSISPGKPKPIRLAIYGRRLFEMSSKIPDEIKLNLVYKEIISRV
jgi:hypothetical protein